jgi:hypothetical protein
MLLTQQKCPMLFATQMAVIALLSRPMLGQRRQIGTLRLVFSAAGMPPLIMAERMQGTARVMEGYVQW